MATWTKRRTLRWLAPLAVLLALVGSGLVAATATAGPALPPRTAEQLLVDLQTAEVDGLSGTVRLTSNLGLPSLPNTGSEHGRPGGPGALLAGEHTLRVWYAGPDQARIAQIDTYGESAVIRNGADVWTWDSREQAVTHRTLSSEHAERPEPPAGAPQTPTEAAQQVLDKLSESTTVSTDNTVTVAGRDAYELVLRPNDTRSLLTEARIAVDAENHSALRVQVFARNQVLVSGVGYDEVDFTRPPAERFAFSPPADAEVTEIEPKDYPKPEQPTQQQREDAAEKVAVVGSGWTAVTVLDDVDATGAGEQLQGVLSQLTPVSGSWGSGRQLNGTAFTAVLTDDGRLAVGAVEPELIYQALAR